MATRPAQSAGENVAASATDEERSPSLSLALVSTRSHLSAAPPRGGVANRQCPTGANSERLCHPGVSGISPTAPSKIAASLRFPGNPPLHLLACNRPAASAPDG